MAPPWCCSTATSLARRCREGAIHPIRSRRSTAPSPACRSSRAGRHHDPRLQAPRHDHAVRRPQRARRHGDRPLHGSATATRSSSASSMPIERAVPAGKVIHVILDNYATHKHPKVRAWLARHPRLDLPLHADLVLLAERGRDLLRRRSPGAASSAASSTRSSTSQAAINRYIDEHNQRPQALRLDRRPQPHPRKRPTRAPNVGVNPLGPCPTW